MNPANKKYIVVAVITVLAVGAFFGLKREIMAPSEMLPVTGNTPSKICVTGGCSGELCVEKGNDVASTCIWDDSYACYKTAKCEVQSDGNCGWTQTLQLQQCLNNRSVNAFPK